MASQIAKVIKTANRHVDRAMQHFDGLYSKVYGDQWPSMRLGLLSPRKYCAVLNTFMDTQEIESDLVDRQQAIDLNRYYKKHLIAYTRWRIRQQIFENKKKRKREMMAKQSSVPVESIDPDTIEVSDVSDREIDGNLTDSARGFSSAEDLAAMFSDRRLDDDEKYFYNKASIQLSLDDYMPATEMIYREDHLDESVFVNKYLADREPKIEIREEPFLDLEGELKVYTFPRNSWSTFDKPSKCGPARLANYYLMDAASLLPVQCLDIKPGDDCADYCAAPGGKSLMMLLSLKPRYLLCNDISSQRLKRLSNTIMQFAPEINYIKSTLELKSANASRLVYKDGFDKILVDVPCSNDRHSAITLENNIFSIVRRDERLNLPFLQSSILKSALKSIKKDGDVVYSTCSMSPYENDGVVARSLLELEKEAPGHKYVIVGLKEALRPYRGLMTFNTKFAYGQQVVPCILSNFGPMYISKIKRIE